jgi:phosphoglycerol geranylgeranyltransferase
MHLFKKVNDTMLVTCSFLLRIQMPVNCGIMLTFATMAGVFQQFNEAKKRGQKFLAVLLDPDHLANREELDHHLELIHYSEVDLILVGGSLLVEDHFHESIAYLKSKTKLPLVIFPGGVQQISGEADAILLLSLISGRNAELLIGQHVLAAPSIRRKKLEAISTGYMLIDCGKATTASYISGTLPIPYNKPEIAAVTAMAGEMLGLSCIYLDGGSGAAKPVSGEMISAVRKSVEVPLIVGGGIRSSEEAELAWQSGADVVVIGTVFEESPEVLIGIGEAKKMLRK